MDFQGGGRQDQEGMPRGQARAKWLDSEGQAAQSAQWGMRKHGRWDGLEIRDYRGPNLGTRLLVGGGVHSSMAIFPYRTHNALYTDDKEIA